MRQIQETPHPAFSHLVTGHFRVGKGYSTWRANGTDDWLLIHTLSGRGRFGYAGGELPANPGDIVLLRPHTRHDYGIDPATGRWDLLWAHFHPRLHWHEWLDWPEAAPGILRLELEDGELRGRVETALYRADTLAQGALRRREEFAMNALEEALLWCDAANPRSEQARLDARVRAAMDYVCSHLAEEVSLDALAAESGLSISRLAHLFRQQTGLTPFQYLEQQRLDRAARLLELTSRSIQAIAHDVGFADPFYFSSRFRRRTGQSPRAYRHARQAV